ncbi:unnamed protein product [Clavelina lepadiformis]|uniref:Uncharacterized protein n=1 Tax=Clavelina lepadiformis TaxID=159417 RepID=A0ABP0G6R0_CLALP
MYTTSVNVIKQLWELSTVTEPLYNADDVWITGLLRNKLEMPDDMVVRPEEHAAKHYRGFENEDGTVKYEVNIDEWNEALKKRKNADFSCFFVSRIWTPGSNEAPRGLWRQKIAPKSAGNELISVVDKGAFGYSAETRLPLNPTLLAISPPCVRILAHQAYFPAPSLYVASPLSRLMEMLI